MRTTLIFIIFCLLTGCNDFDNKVFITDKNYYEIKRQYSPDKTKLLLTYGADEGATGQGEVGTAVLNLSDTSKNILPFTIAWHEYDHHEWLNNDTAVFYLDYLSKMRQSKFIKNHFDTLINGIHIKYSYKDLVDNSYKADTLLNQLSPDNQNRLIVYRYTKDNSNNNFLNISVTKVNDTIPRYGNFFISDIKDDYIYYCKWSDKHKLLLYTTSSCQYIIENYLVQNRSDIPIEIKVKDDVQSSFRWTEKNGY
jgi:hypothetical protein